MTKTTGELSDILYLLQRTPSPGGRAIRPCADTVAPRALRPEIGPYRRPDFHADAADRSGPSVAPKGCVGRMRNWPLEMSVANLLLQLTSGCMLRARVLGHQAVYFQLLKKRLTYGNSTPRFASVRPRSDCAR